MGFHGHNCFRDPFNIENGHSGFGVMVTLLFLLLTSSVFLLLLIHTLPHSPERPLWVPTPTQSFVHMDDLCCHIHDDVVTLIIEHADDSQLVFEWVVGVKTQVLVSVCHFPVYLDLYTRHPYVRSESLEKGCCHPFLVHR